MKKKIHPLITYPVLVIFSIILVFVPTFLYVSSPSFAQGVFVPFEGRITNVDYYSCVCGLSVLLTVEPTTEVQSAKQERQLLFFYGPQALEELGFDFGFVPIPRVFVFYLIWYAGPQKLLGLYTNARLPCVAYAGTSCTVSGYYPAIWFVGTSVY
ncbi:hypothetical protein L0Y40_00135 [Candidatus Wolfebacteria bacterium]|nr:hypothetical protein [Candidatus Wolfebacteria bacterium]